MFMKPGAREEVNGGRSCLYGQCFEEAAGPLAGPRLDRGSRGSERSGLLTYGRCFERACSPVPMAVDGGRGIGARGDCDGLQCFAGNG